MKKVTLLGFVLALTLSAFAQPSAKTPPNATGRGAHAGVPPVAKVPPVVVRGGRK